MLQSYLPFCSSGEGCEVHDLVTLGKIHSSASPLPLGVGKNRYLVVPVREAARSSQLFQP